MAENMTDFKRVQLLKKRLPNILSTPKMICYLEKIAPLLETGFRATFLRFMIASSCIVLIA